MKQPVIKFAEVEEIGEVRQLDPHSEYIDRNRILSKIQQREIIVAKTDTLVGLLKFSYFWATRPYIDLIYITEQYRGLGFSNQLLDYLVNFLATGGYSYLFSSSEEKDTKAQSWHLHHGFKQMGILTDLNLPRDTTREIFYSLKFNTASDIPKYPI
jgi:ribosomal protein S18 acetylase RimI-like enzyme